MWAKQAKAYQQRGYQALSPRFVVPIYDGKQEHGPGKYGITPSMPKEKSFVTL